MKTRYRVQEIGGMFDKKNVLVLQVYKHIPEGPDDFNGIPEWLSCNKWMDATVEDLQEILSITQD